MTTQKIRIVGTTHLTPGDEIIRIILTERPDVIGVELCETRLNLMVKNVPKVEEQKQDNSLISKISNAIKKKAEENNIQYSSDMIAASRYALDNNIPLICLDKDIIEIKNLIEKIPQSEQQGFLQELAKFESESLTKEINEEQTLKELKERYPVAFEFLITLRNLHIENNIFKTIRKYPYKNILIFLGRGHVKEIERAINE